MVGPRSQSGAPGKELLQGVVRCRNALSVCETYGLQSRTRPARKRCFHVAR